MNICHATTVDTGLRSSPENIRLDRDQWRAAQQMQAPFCFVRFHRSFRAVSLGSLETSGHALRAEYCRRHGIDIVRRVSGGGAVYLDTGQLCWTMTLSRPAAGAPTRLAEWLAWLSAGVVHGLRGLGVTANFSAPNDIEVDGRKLASGFLTLSASAVLYQGSLLRTIDTETMMKALRVATEKLTPQGIRTARQRFATLRELGVDLEPDIIQRHLLAGWAEQLHWVFAPPSKTGHDLVTNADDGSVPLADWEAEDGHWHRAFVKTRGGVLHARLRLSRDGRTLQQTEFAGGVHVYPGHLLTALAAWLAMTPVAALDGQLDVFFRTRTYDMLQFAPTDVRRVLQLALDRYAQQIQFTLSDSQANTLMVHAPRQQTAVDIAQAASVMLVPYCAKPCWCKWRHLDGCSECGMCEVGEAYRLGRERGLRVITITNYEHLEKTLGELRAQGTPAYVGMCCRDFYIKREYAFRAAGIPAVLMDISGANCYALQQEDLAYAGKFKAQSHLNLEVLQQVLACA
ncbi:MAG: lipoate--protein ligase family protein [Sulfuricaulis sp.]